MAMPGAFDIAPQSCSAEAGLRLPSIEIGSGLKAGSGVAAIPIVGWAVPEVKASGFSGPPSEAEDPVRIRSPQESTTNFKFPNLIS